MSLSGYATYRPLGGGVVQPGRARRGKIFAECERAFRSFLIEEAAGGNHTAIALYEYPKFPTIVQD